MDDDKTIEAALDAWDGVYDAELKTGAYSWTDNRDAAMRAALAAADKVRAGGFAEQAADIAKALPSRWTAFAVQIATTRIADALSAAFAAGLAKGAVKLEAATSTLEDEQASHQETLALLAKSEASLQAQKDLADEWYIAANKARDDLAKGDAERAALREAREAMDHAHHVLEDYSWDLKCRNQAAAQLRRASNRIDAALSAASGEACPTCGRVDEPSCKTVGCPDDASGEASGDECAECGVTAERRRRIGECVNPRCPSRPAPSEAPNVGMETFDEQTIDGVRVTSGAPNVEKDQ